MLSSASKHYQVMQRLAATAVAGARRRRGDLRQLASFLAAMQALAAKAGDEAVRDMVMEQSLDSERAAELVMEAFAGLTPNGDTLAEALQKATSEDGESALDSLVATLVADAGRQAQAVGAVATRTVTGHVRYLNPPSCGRCVVMAGRYYRYNEAFEGSGPGESYGFLRHVNCDCVMVPTTDEAAPGLVLDSQQAFEDGQITGLSKAEAAALDAGANLGQVINVRRREAGMMRAGRVMKRGARLTPEGIFDLADGDRDRVIELLAKAGYFR